MGVSAHTMGRMTHFGELIKTLRNRARMTQYDLARAAGLSIAAIQHIEAGERNRLRYGNHRKIAQAFKMTDEQLDDLAAGGEKTETLRVPLKMFTQLQS